MADHALDEKEVSAPETKEDRSAKRWLDLILDAETAFKTYQDKCDKIDKRYADLEALSGVSTDREFQIFWANLEVLKPTIYSRAPLPVVVPRFNNRAPLARKAADLLERAMETDFDADDVHSTIKLVRDDMVTSGRGQAWVRFTEDEKTPAEHIDRKDFLHGPAREWREVPWVARRSFLTRKAGKKRFGDAFKNVQMRDRGDKEVDFKGEKKGEVWEIWHKVENSVIWVSPGKEDVLDIKPPILRLEGFYPCPRPAYGTLQRRTLIPVPDYLFYKDQVEEINEMTARISSLSESLRLKGFYPAGAPDVGEAIERVIKDQSNRAVLVPISNMAALGSGSLKDAIIWLPVREVAEVITNLIQLRRQLIEDVYEITGLSDIMRGQTKASETLGAQQLKAQFGSIRVLDRQAEMVRFARDIGRLKAEIMAEHFSGKTLLEMSQLDDLPEKKQIDQQIQAITTKLEQASRDPKILELARQNPEQAQQVVQQAQAQIQGLQSIITIDAVVDLLRNERLRPFTLDIETDSTIQPNEDQEKKRRAEFLTAVGGFIAQAGPMVAAQPETAPFVAEALKFTAGGFRAGRDLDDAIDQFAEKVKEVAAQPKPNPEAEAAKAEAEIEKAKLQIEGALVKAQIEKLQAETAKIAQGEPPEDTGPTEIEVHGAKMAGRKIDLDEAKLTLERDKHTADILASDADRETSLKEALVGAGFPPDYRFDRDRDATDAALLERETRVDEKMAALLEQQNTQFVSMMQAFIQAMTAPKQIVRDQSGRAVGIKTAVN